ncbi:expressed protein, partial [Aureococcus anophagefferens]
MDNVMDRSMRFVFWVFIGYSLLFVTFAVHAKIRQILLEHTAPLLTRAEARGGGAGLLKATKLLPPRRALSRSSPLKKKRESIRAESLTIMKSSTRNKLFGDRVLEEESDEEKGGEGGAPPAPDAHVVDVEVRRGGYQSVARGVEDYRPRHKPEWLERLLLFYDDRVKPLVDAILGFAKGGENIAVRHRKRRPALPVQVLVRRDAQGPLHARHPAHDPAGHGHLHRRAPLGLPAPALRGPGLQALPVPVPFGVGLRGPGPAHGLPVQAPPHRPGLCGRGQRGIAPEPAERRAGHPPPEDGGGVRSVEGGLLPAEARRRRAGPGGRRRGDDDAPRARHGPEPDQRGRARAPRAHRDRARRGRPPGAVVARDLQRLRQRPRGVHRPRRDEGAPVEVLRRLLAGRVGADRQDHQAPGRRRLGRDLVRRVLRLRARARAPRGHERGPGGAHPGHVRHHRRGPRRVDHGPGAPPDDLGDRPGAVRRRRLQPHQGHRRRRQRRVGHPRVPPPAQPRRLPVRAARGGAPRRPRPRRPRPRRPRPRRPRPRRPRPRRPRRRPRRRRPRPRPPLARPGAGRAHRGAAARRNYAAGRARRDDDDARPAPSPNDLSL